MTALRNLTDVGLVISWRRWQVSLALLGIVIYFTIADWNLEGSAASPDRPFAQISRDDHDAPVWSLAFSGSTRSASSTSSELRVKDLATGRVVQLLSGRESFGLPPTFSADGKTLAIGVNEPRIRLWDAETLTELRSLYLATGRARSIAFSPDGANVAVATRKSRDVNLYDWPRRRPTALLNGRYGDINLLAFSPDSSKLVTADSSSHVCIWDRASRRERVHYQAHRSGIATLVLSPDGTLIATASFLDDAIRLWDANDGSSRGILPNASTGVTGLAFSPDGTMLAVSRSDGVATLWELASRRPIAEVKVSTGSLQAIAFTGDGLIFATAGFDGAVRHWDVAKLAHGQSHAATK